MSVPIQYVGSTDPYFETAVTGKPTKWTRGRVADVDEADALLLIQTGLFGAAPGGSSLDTRYTSALIAALADAAGLTPRTWYAASDTGVAYWCSYASTAQPLSTVVHLGTITTATMLAYSSPTEGMTCDVSDAVSGAVVRARYNGSAWRAVGPARIRVRGAGSISTSAQYPTNTRIAFSAGALTLFNTFDLHLKLNLVEGAGDTVTAVSVYLGSLGDASDAAILSLSGLTATQEQRAWYYTGAFESASSVRIDPPYDGSQQGYTGQAATTAGAAQLVSLGSDDTSDALYCGVGYTMGVSANACTTMLMLTLYP